MSIGENIRVRVPFHQQDFQMHRKYKKNEPAYSKIEDFQTPKMDATYPNTPTERPTEDRNEIARRTSWVPVNRRRPGMKRRLDRRQRKMQYRLNHSLGRHVDHYCRQCQHDHSGLLDHYCSCSHNTSCNHYYEEGDDHWCPGTYTLSLCSINEEVLERMNTSARNRVANDEPTLDY